MLFYLFFSLKWTKIVKQRLNKTNTASEVQIIYLGQLHFI